MQNRRSSYRNSLSLLSGIGLGAGLMYLFDPNAGRRHRRDLRRTSQEWLGRAGKNIGSARQSLMESARNVRQNLMPRSGLLSRRYGGYLAGMLPSYGMSRRMGLSGRMRQSASNLYERGRERMYGMLPERMGRKSLYIERSSEMPSRSVGMLRAVGYGSLGAFIAYLFDPRGGNRRRSLIRDKFVSLWRHSGDEVGDVGRYLRGQFHGLIAILRRPFQGQTNVSDAKLIARVRSVLGRACSHPHAIRVDAEQGHVLLRGLILTDELPRVISRVSRVRGVQEVINQIECHNEPENIPSLQGQGGKVGRRFDLMQEYWSPTTRLTIGGIGACMTTYGLARRGLTGAAMSLIGAGLLTRAATNLPAKRLTGIRAGRRAIDVQKTININAPIEEVFRFWANYDNFPHFMHNIREVRDLGNGRSRWVVAGPAGVPVEWNAVITDYLPNEIIAWKSESGSVIANAGVVRFERNDDGTTRVDVKMSYNPPAGAIGHGLATLFGADPKHEMDQDLLRVKTMLETGHPAHDAAQPLHEAHSR